MIALGVVALATLAANGSRQLRYSAVALLGVSLAANVLTAGQLTVTQLAVEGCGALVACGILYVAARDRTYGEDPGWRLWLATIVAAAATAACFATLRTASSETVIVPPLIGEDPSGVTAQVAAFCSKDVLPDRLVTEKCQRVCHQLPGASKFSANRRDENERSGRHRGKSGVKLTAS